MAKFKVGKDAGCCMFPPVSPCLPCVLVSPVVVISAGAGSCLITPSQGHHEPRVRNVKNIKPELSALSSDLTLWSSLALLIKPTAGSQLSLINYQLCTEREAGATLLDDSASGGS